MSEVQSQLNFVTPGEYPGIGRVSEEAAQIPIYRTYNTVISQLNIARFGGTITAEGNISAVTATSEGKAVAPDFTRTAELLAELGEKLVNDDQSVEEIREYVAELNDEIQLTDNEYYILDQRIQAAQIRQKLAKDMARWNAEKAVLQALNTNGIAELSAPQPTAPQHIILPDVNVEMSNEPVGQLSEQIQSETTITVESAEQVKIRSEELISEFENTLKEHGNEFYSTDSVPNEAYRSFQKELGSEFWLESGQDKVKYAKLCSAVTPRLEAAFVQNHLAKELSVEVEPERIVSIVAPLKPVTTEIEPKEVTEVADSEIVPADETTLQEAKDSKLNDSSENILENYEVELRTWADENRDNQDTVKELKLLFRSKMGAYIRKGWTQKQFDNSPEAKAIFGIMSEELWGRTGAKTGEKVQYMKELKILSKEMNAAPEKIDQLVIRGKKAHKTIQRIGYRVLDATQGVIERSKNNK